MQFRLLTTGFSTGALNMAIDEAVLEAVSRHIQPFTLRLYGWSPACVSIGYFQSLEEEVDVAACRKHNVDFVRRMTGGGAVFHEHEITYSIHIPEAAGFVPAGILESYEKISGGVIKGLATLGIEAKFVPLNDLIVNHTGMSQKISGNAQTRKQGVILQHGTILLKVDVEKMFSLLQVPDEKMKGKLISDIKQRVTSVSAAIGREVLFEEAQKALLSGFGDEFKAAGQFVADQLSPDEMKRARQLVQEKYAADSWNKKR